jgi:DNA-binding transcriptional regulator YdaS (Cro superfamily)
MTLKEYLDHHQIKYSAFGRRIGVAGWSVKRYIDRERQITAERAIAIEQATNGEVTRQELRPDLWPQVAA